MEEFIEQMRNDHRDFDSGSLEGFFGHEPYDLFSKWYGEALGSNQPEPNAFVLSTVDDQNRPSSRILYLKELLDKKFVFYTNYNSQKGKDLAKNPFGSMLFFWPSLHRQIRIDGVCEKVPEEMSDSYFAARPRGSQIGAWASHQSEELVDRKTLEERTEVYATKFPDLVPRPAHWGGYALKPLQIEFWQGRPSRLHDRIVYIFENNDWKIIRKNP